MSCLLAVEEGADVGQLMPQEHTGVVTVEQVIGAPFPLTVEEGLRRRVHIGAGKT